MFKFVVIVIGAVACTQAFYMSGENKDLIEIDSIYYEEKCVMQGGLCVIESDCPEPTTIKGLCPEQQHKGVECCYGTSVKETRCKKHGGSCSYSCPYKYTFIKQPTDCPEDTVCCIYVY